MSTKDSLTPQGTPLPGSAHSHWLVEREHDRLTHDPHNTYQMDDSKVRHTEELAAGMSPSCMLSCSRAVELQQKVAELEQKLGEEQEKVSENAKNATSALSELFGRLARERALHECETTRLKHKLMDVSQQLLARKVREREVVAHLDALDVQAQTGHCLPFSPN